jgi:hypothetical protein
MYRLPMGLAAVPWDRCETHDICDRFAEAWNARQDVAGTVSGMSLGTVAAAALLFYTICQP